MFKEVRYMLFKKEYLKRVEEVGFAFPRYNLRFARNSFYRVSRFIRKIPKAIINSILNILPTLISFKRKVCQEPITYQELDKSTQELIDVFIKSSGFKKARDKGHLYLTKEWYVQQLQEIGAIKRD